MTDRASLNWRDMSEAPKDQELLVKGGHYQVAAAIYPDWDEVEGVALVQWRDGDGWRGEMFDGDYLWYRPTHFITVDDLLAPPTTEPPHSINTNELLEAAKEARIIVEKWCHYQGNAPELFAKYLAPLDTAISNAAKAI